MPPIDGESLKDVKGRIRFDNVHFRSPTCPGVRVLRVLDLNLECGTLVVLINAGVGGKRSFPLLPLQVSSPFAQAVLLFSELGATS